MILDDSTYRQLLTQIEYFKNIKISINKKHIIIKPEKVPAWFKSLKDITIKLKSKQKGYSSEFKNKAKIIKEKEKVCKQCWSDYYLMVHHIDKNKHNNNDSNLILLCFNCHKLHHKHLRVPSFMKK